MLELAPIWQPTHCATVLSCRQGFGELSCPIKQLAHRALRLVGIYAKTESPTPRTAAVLCENPMIRRRSCRFTQARQKLRGPTKRDLPRPPETFVLTRP